MIFRYVWLDPHRRVVEIGPNEDGSFLYLIDAFIQCNGLKSQSPGDILRIQGGVSIAEIPLSSGEGIARRAEALIDEVYGIVQIISLEIASSRQLSEELLKRETERSEAEARSLCLSE